MPDFIGRTFWPTVFHMVRHLMVMCGFYPVTYSEYLSLLCDKIKTTIILFTLMSYGYCYPSKVKHVTYNISVNDLSGEALCIYILHIIMYV